MKNTELVQKIDSHYVRDDCVQTRIPFKKQITIIDKNGIVCHYKDGSNLIINNYLKDKRRYQFPYHNIPISKGKQGLIKYNYINQIFNLNEPYIRIIDGIIIESIAVKDQNEALLLKKILQPTKTTTFKTRKELEEMFKQPREENKQLYILNSNFDIFQQQNILQSEEYFSSLNKDRLFSNDFIFLTTTKTQIFIKAISIKFIKQDYYEVATLDMDVINYTLDQIKSISSKIINCKEPNISPRLNPNIPKENIKKNKQLIRRLKKYE